MSEKKDKEKLMINETPPERMQIIFSIDGEWSGFYRYEGYYIGATFPITATLMTDGAKITGTMVDGITTISDSYESVAARSIEKSKDSRQQTNDFLNAYPNAMVERSWPAQSVLEGEITNEYIRFIKRYSGNATNQLLLGSRPTSLYGLLVGWLLSPWRFSQRISLPVADMPPVEYVGTLDAPSGMIQGGWILRVTRQQSSAPATIIEGTFILHKMD